MTPTTPTNDDPALFAAVAEAWPRLPLGIQQAFAALIVNAAGQQSGPARHTRHRHYSADEIQGLRMKIPAILAESSTLPNRIIAERLAVPISSFKAMGLHKFTRQVLAGIANTSPHSASCGYDGARADQEGNDEAE